MTILPFEEYKDCNDNHFDNQTRMEFITISPENTVLVRHRINPANQHKWIDLEHEWCGGTIEIQNVKKYKVIYCKHCKFRKTFPSYINTAAQLRKYFYKQDEKERIESRLEILDL